MIKYIIAIVLSFLIFGCSSAPSETEMKSMNLHLGDSSYAELVDFLYDYAGENRLTVLWFGSYRVDNAKHWYESSDKDSNFKIKLELLTEENGYIYVANHFDEKIADLVIDYGDKNPIWLAVVDDFQKAIAAKGWRMEELKKEAPKKE
jgi:hypothetical protein